MHYEENQITLKNNLKVTIKTLEPIEVMNLLLNMYPSESTCMTRYPKEDISKTDFLQQALDTTTLRSIKCFEPRTIRI